MVQLLTHEVTGGRLRAIAAVVKTDAGAIFAARQEACVKSIFKLEMRYWYKRMIDDAG